MYTRCLANATAITSVNHRPVIPPLNSSLEETTPSRHTRLCTVHEVRASGLGVKLVIVFSLLRVDAV